MNSATLFVTFLQSLYQLTATSSVKLYEKIDENNHRQLTCLFAMNNDHSIDSILMYAKSLTNDTFHQITLFKPDKMAAFTSNGEYLLNRATLTNITKSSNEATINFRNILCEDEKEYYCKIKYTDKDYIQNEMNSIIYKLVLKAAPTKPDNIFPFDTQKVVEGDDVTFICKGNVGNPPGKYLWQTVRNDTTKFLYKNVSTAVTQVSYPGSCKYNGTSNLTMTVTAEDNQAIVRCVEQSLNGLEHMYAQSKPLNVLYKVRKTRITKHPNKDFYLVGSNPIKLICSADGNPPCTYTWYKSNNLSCILSKESSLVISPVNITSNGTYLCAAMNEFKSNLLTHNQTIHIYVIFGTPEQHTDSDSIRNTAIILTCVVTCVVVVVLIYCKKKKRRISQDTVLNICNEQAGEVSGVNNSIGLAKKNNLTEKESKNPVPTSVYPAATKKRKSIDSTENITQGFAGNDSQFEEDDPYADSFEGMYDHLHNRRHKEQTDCEPYNF